MANVNSQLRRLCENRTVRALAYGFLLYCDVTAIIHYLAFWYPHARAVDRWYLQELSVASLANVSFSEAFGLRAAGVALFRPEEGSLDRRGGCLYPMSSTSTGEARSKWGGNAMKLAAPAVAGDLHFLWLRVLANQRARSG